MNLEYTAAAAAEAEEAEEAEETLPVSDWAAVAWLALSLLYASRSASVNLILKWATWLGLGLGLGLG